MICLAQSPLEQNNDLIAFAQGPSHVRRPTQNMQVQASYQSAAVGNIDLIAQSWGNPESLLRVFDMI